jgi:hypothetical protein
MIGADQREIADHHPARKGFVPICFFIKTNPASQRLHRGKKQACQS